MKQSKWILLVLCTFAAIAAFFAVFTAHKSVLNRKRMKKADAEQLPDGVNKEAYDSIEGECHDE